MLKNKLINLKKTTNVHTTTGINVVVETVVTFFLSKSAEFSISCLNLGLFKICLRAKNLSQCIYLFPPSIFPHAPLIQSPHKDTDITGKMKGIWGIKEILWDTWNVGGRAILHFSLLWLECVGWLLVGAGSRSVSICKLSFPEISASESLPRSLVYSR